MSPKRKAPDSPGTPSKRARKVLTLEEKISVIDTVENGKSHRAIALIFNVGRTQVNHIIQNKDTYRNAFQESMNADIKYLVPRNMLYPDIDQQVWDFFCQARSKCIPINDPMLQSEANKIAMKHNHNNFPASNGWLKCFCARHQIKFSSLHRESADVSSEAVQQWLQDLPELTEGYEQHNIFNCDETSIFFKALPQKTLLGPAEKPAGIKTSKEHFSLLVCANAVGKKRNF